MCENCEMGGHNHLTSRCKNPTKWVNCGKGHPSRSNVCEVSIKEKDILKIKVTNNITCLEAKMLYKQKPEFTFSKVVHSAQVTKPETKTTETYFDEKDFNVQPAQKLSYQLTTNQTSNQHKTQQQLKNQIHHLILVHPNRTVNMKDLDLRHGQQVGTSVNSLKQNKKKNQMSKLQDQSIKTTNKYGHLESMES